MDGLLELLGRRADRADVLHTEYRKILALLQAIRVGDVLPNRLVVDLANDSWSVLPAPSTVPNGEEPQPAAVPTKPPGVESGANGP